TEAVEEETTIPVADISNEPLELSLEEPLQETIEAPEAKKILIAKKFLLSRRVLAKVLDNLGYEYDILDDIGALQSELASEKYDMLFTDSELVTDAISQAYENIAIISANNTQNPQEVTVQKGETISNTASKEDIENIITKYRV
ncbi:MAG TPA: hypothetical protein VLL31_04110, partial [Sulfurovum sp.]|nr:hypothetical protein [Sulfurovum sp.]